MVDKVDLLLGPYGTNFVAPAMPTIIQNNKLTISFTAIGINDKFHYPKYFSMVSTGPEGVDAFSIGFFDMAAAQQPKPQTVAILAADAERAPGPVICLLYGRPLSHASHAQFSVGNIVANAGIRDHILALVS